MSVYLRQIKYVLNHASTLSWLQHRTKVVIYLWFFICYDKCPLWWVHQPLLLLPVIVHKVARNESSTVFLKIYSDINYFTKPCMVCVLVSSFLEFVWPSGTWLILKYQILPPIWVLLWSCSVSHWNMLAQMKVDDWT